jgi:hypothetical protein
MPGFLNQRENIGASTTPPLPPTLSTISSPMLRNKTIIYNDVTRLIKDVLSDFSDCFAVISRN